MRLLRFAAIVLLASAGSVSYSLDEAPPAQIGLSEEKLAEVTSFLRSEVDDGRIAGAVGLVARHGRIGYLEAVGMADREAERPMTTDTLFRIASMTKAVTSAGVMMLVEEEAIRLDDPVSEFIPEFADPRVLAGDGSSAEPASREITIRDLLTHTSGIGYGWFGPAAQDDLYRAEAIDDILVPCQESIGERAARLGRLPLAFEPGERWGYGLSIDVLGRVIEVATGLTLDQFLHERIFRPLGMRDTYFYLPAGKHGRLAALYTPDEANTSLDPVGAEVRASGPIRFTADFCLEGKGNLLAGGSGLVSSALDYARFLQTLLDGGGPILERKTVDMMTRNQIGALRIPFGGHGDGFGFGSGVVTERGKTDDIASVGTYSWGGIFNTYYWVDPQEKMVGILMTQIFPNSHLNTRSEFKRRTYDAIDDAGFSRTFWYEKGIEHGNPFFNDRQLRVNAPEAGVSERFAGRSEVRSPGTARILIEEDLRQIRSAALYCEVWGGHPGTGPKGVAVNGRGSFPLQDLRTAAGHCTHQYPVITLSPKDLVNGYNSIQFACEQGSSFWGHFIVDNVGVRVGLTDCSVGMTGFRATVTGTPDPMSESIRLALESSDLSEIETVTYRGRYFGYDENGDGIASDWHGMTKAREPYGVIGSATKPPFAIDWDTSMLPTQSDVAVRAEIHFRNAPDLAYQTPVTRGFEIPARGASTVSIHYADDLPVPFWSRAGREKSCTITLNTPENAIEAAELHVVTWTGGAGSVKNYFTLNGHSLPVAEGNGHDVSYTRIPVARDILREGANYIRLLSDTEHHGIELLFPGPALAVRSDGTQTSH